MTLHDVEPSTFERCALIREWLDDLGIERTTLLVSPAADRAPGLATWLRERASAGDEIVQQGAALRRTRTRRARRLDLHPADLDHPRRVMALERVLRRALR